MVVKFGIKTLWTLYNMHLSDDKIRAARGMLGLSQSELSEISGVSLTSIKKAEAGHSMQMATLQRIKMAFDALNIEFLHDGVRKRENSVRLFEGQEGFLSFYDDVFNTLKTTDDRNVFVNNVDERPFVKWQGEQLIQHKARMKDLNAKYKILIKHGDDFLPASDYAKYRWLPEGSLLSVPTYLYGNKIAFIIFNNSLKIYIINQTEISIAFKAQFEELWNNSIDVVIGK